MKRLLLTILFLAGITLPGVAQTRERLSGWCEQGNQQVTTDGRQSTTKVQRSFSSCTVTVYDAGTTNLASIASDYGGTPKSNPFTASSTGFWDFFGLDGRYDVRLSGSGITSPYTIPGLWITHGSGSTPLSCSADQLPFFDSNGSVQACLTLGTNLSITSGVLNAAGGGGSCPPNTGLASHLAYYPSNGCTLDDTPDTIYGVGHAGLGLYNGIQARYSAPGEAGVTLEFSAGDGGTGANVFAGNLYLSAGSAHGSASSNGGDVRILAGTGSGATADGGRIFINTGTPGFGSSGAGGTIAIASPSGAISGLGGDFSVAAGGTLTMGSGNGSATSINKNGRQLVLEAGSGYGPGNGGPVTLHAGDARATGGGTGNGGQVTLSAGNGGDASGNGGNILLGAGQNIGTGSVGHVLIQDSSIHNSIATLDTTSLINDRTFIFQYRNSSLGSTLYFSDPPTSDFASLGTPSDGTWRYCLDCASGTDPCTGGSSGSPAFRVNGAWTCQAAGGGGGSGITTLNGLTAGTQIFANANDTNVTLSIGSSVATHTFTMGWTGTLGVARGGTNLASYTAGDLLYATGATTLAKLGIGTNGQCLKTSAGLLPEWGSCGGGGGSPGGSDTYVQFNDAATFGGSAAFSWNKTTSVMTLGVASTTTGTLKFADAGGATTTSFKAGNAASSLTFVYPVVDPTAGQVLSASAPSTGVVTLSWVTAGTPASPTDSVQYNSGAGFGGNAKFTYNPTSSTNLNIQATSTNRAAVKIKAFDDSGFHIPLSVYNDGETAGLEYEPNQQNTTTGDDLGVFNALSTASIGVVTSKSGSAAQAGFNAYTLNNSYGLRMNNANTGNSDLTDIPNSAVWKTSSSNADGGILIVASSSNAPIKFGTGGSGTSNLRVTIPKDGGMTLSGIALASLPSSSNGTLIYCTDCAVNTDPCTASSSGALAVRLNGRWYCP